MNWLGMLALAIAVMLTLDHARQPDDLDQQQATYCEMVQTFKDTRGQYGWPDYRGNAAEVCK
ncbi:hypothetical protein [Pseudomonas phage Persinger]|uniref:Uncharacterized protein n=1 Tax=Pseudomonas phage Persinger TaxID=2749430 RepID=A0A7D7JBK1_9CAUD|nr:hypothetical protein KB682_gp21 [Pseudomonas phage Persinger]QMP19209.1 hypothetical protein [Pseudomonas phage Persinger]